MDHLKVSMPANTANSSSCEATLPFPSPKPLSVMVALLRLNVEGLGQDAVGLAVDLWQAYLVKRSPAAAVYFYNNYVIKYRLNAYQRKFFFEDNKNT